MADALFLALLLLLLLLARLYLRRSMMSAETRVLSRQQQLQLTARKPSLRVAE